MSVPSLLSAPRADTVATDCFKASWGHRLSCSRDACHALFAYLCPCWVDFLSTFGPLCVLRCRCGSVLPYLFFYRVSTQNPVYIYIYIYRLYVYIYMVTCCQIVLFVKCLGACCQICVIVHTSKYVYIHIYGNMLSDMCVCAYTQRYLVIRWKTSREIRSGANLVSLSAGSCTDVYNLQIWWLNLCVTKLSAGRPNRYNTGAPQTCTSCTYTNQITKFNVTKLCYCVTLFFRVRARRRPPTQIACPSYLEIPCLGAPRNQCACKY